MTGYTLPYLLRVWLFLIGLIHFYLFQVIYVVLPSQPSLICMLKSLPLPPLIDLVLLFFYAVVFLI